MSESQPTDDLGPAFTSWLDSLDGWESIDRPPPFATWVLAWLHLPLNPLASMPVIAQRCYVERELAGEPDYVEGCWWANGRYYAPGYVTHWMSLPEPPK